MVLFFGGSDQTQHNITAQPDLQRRFILELNSWQKWGLLNVEYVSLGKYKQDMMNKCQNLHLIWKVYIIFVTGRLRIWGICCEIIYTWIWLHLTLTRSRNVKLVDDSRSFEMWGWVLSFSHFLFIWRQGLVFISHISL